ncbi:hypothetical protein KR009_000234 [Drosophila setifemur]|nr:hypothetical protein KR009_000234 [Drosophila setifemur]
MNQRHSEPFYISPRLFDNRRFKRRRSRWLEPLRERQRWVMSQMRAQAQVQAHLQATKTERGGRRRHPHGRHVHVHTLPADVTIDLLSDDDDEPAPVPITRLRVLQPNLLLIPASVPESILITSDDEELPGRLPTSRRSPPPLAPLSLSETVEEVTVSLVPCSSTTAHCQARIRHSHPPLRLAPVPTANGSGPDNYHLEVDVGGGGIAASLPDETTVHTVIANRIYELSLSKLREGLASSGVPEYSHDLMPEQLQKLSPALRAKVAPLVAPSPPAPISLKLSSDLSISLISDDDECEGNSQSLAQAGPPVVAAAEEARAAARLLKQQQPQLSVVQHLQYTGGGLAGPVALALPVMTSPPPLQLPPRRRKLG